MNKDKWDYRYGPGHPPHDMKLEFDLCIMDAELAWLAWERRISTSQSPDSPSADK